MGRESMTRLNQTILKKLRERPDVIRCAYFRVCQQMESALRPVPRIFLSPDVGEATGFIMAIGIANWVVGDAAT